MSKVFYDHLISLDKLEKEIKKATKSREEREELYQMVDEMIHHKVIGCVLDRLHEDHHQDFLSRFVEAPHDEGLIDYLKDRMTEDIEVFIRAEINMLAKELLKIVEQNTRPAKKLRASN